jgi:hypothetical protein
MTCLSLGQSILTEHLVSGLIGRIAYPGAATPVLQLTRPLTISRVWGSFDLQILLECDRQAWCGTFYSHAIVCPA